MWKFYKLSSCVYVCACVCICVYLCECAVLANIACHSCVTIDLGFWVFHRSRTC